MIKGKTCTESCEDDDDVLYLGTEYKLSYAHYKPVKSSALPVKCLDDQYNFLKEHDELVNRLRDYEQQLADLKEENSRLKNDINILEKYSLLKRKEVSFLQNSIHECMMQNDADSNASKLEIEQLRNELTLKHQRPQERIVHKANTATQTQSIFQRRISAITNTPLDVFNFPVKRRIQEFIDSKQRKNLEREEIPNDEVELIDDNIQKKKRRANLDEEKVGDDDPMVLRAKIYSEFEQSQRRVGRSCLRKKSYETKDRDERSDFTNERFR
ncbi:hypothetical protein ACOME3_004788 [Neoechinorhynchus agilis]